jgi:hypothetical protein
MRDRNSLVLGLACLSLPASIIGGCSSENPATERTTTQDTTTREAPEAVEADPVVGAAATTTHAGITRFRDRSEVTVTSGVSAGCTRSQDTLVEGSGGDFKLPSGATAASLAPVLWGAGVNPGNAAPIASLASALGASASGIVFFAQPTFEAEPYMSWLQAAYGIPPVIGVSTTQTITPTVCNASTSPCTITDAQIQQELARQVSLGKLEVGSALIYVLEFPPNVTISQGGKVSCQSGGFCAYHYFTSINGTSLPYIVLPDFAGTGCKGGCGNWPTWQGEMSAVLSHETMETLTDPVVGTGWLSSDSTCDEIGDICNLQDVQIDNAGYSAVVQKMWSNSLQSCIATTQGPDIVSVTPSSGLGTATTPVTVTGTGLSSSTTFLFGSLPATGVSCTSSTQCTMVAPASNGFGSSSATVPVLAINPAGYESAQEPNGDSFTYQCVPTGCSSTSCGAAPDGCGGTLSCGSCPGGEPCNNNRCCQPSTCGELGKDCGTYSDGCGGEVACGSCPSSMVCQSGVCVGSGGSGGTFCENCRKTGGICTTSGGKSTCIHE